MTISGVRVKDKAFKLTTGLHRAVFRATRGRIFGRVLGMPVVELGTIGRRSGALRSTMLTAPIVEPDRLVLVASFGGDDRHPAWYFNLRANPMVRATIGGSTHVMTARTATDDERAQLWPRIVATYRGYERYQERADRLIPVVILERTP